jgi:hypothetical protein
MLTFAEVKELYKTDPLARRQINKVAVFLAGVVVFSAWVWGSILLG